ncbi:Glycosyl transferase family 8 [Friedmanniella luteola]|uniref:Glycosyl transferase family 8 n=1 Tax=Friedmanniella luteola TaxID=546871 RepID=A0A1H1U1S8_9ACTN|nr:glycosyltransferase [Friedmanniella luteola]SDS66450.1 Glycosyl transferase family 8 [Friedmanniella luteola]
MPSLARRLARRHLPHRVRRAGLVLAGHEPAGPTRAELRAAAQQATAEKVATAVASAERRAARARKAAGPAPQPLADTVRRGGSLDEAVTAEVVHLLAAGDPDAAVALGTGLLRTPATAASGDLAVGLTAASRGDHALAWSRLSRLDPQVWSRHAARAWCVSGLDQDPAATLRQITALVADRPDWVPTRTWLELLGPVFGRGEQELARSLHAVLDQRVGAGDGVERDLVVQRDWLRRWIAAEPGGHLAPAPPEGSVAFAIMDYDHPGRSRASANIGDHVQSLASLGHLVRHQDLEFEGAQDLVDLVGQLRGRVRPELARTGVRGRVQLLQVDRDASEYATVPAGTWTLAFGWFMHAIFESRFGFPLHPGLRPLFVSFHASKRDLLVPEAIEHLRRYAPIGCRDWTTVDLLLSAGVPAFFSGCMTTTVRTVFPAQVERPAADAPVGYVDMPAAAVPAGAVTYAHSSDKIRFRSFARNVGDAVSLLETYRRRHPAMVTSRLHCYLPVRALDVPVDFQPKNRSDPRFAGLIDITDDEFAAIQERIDTRLELVLGAALGGAAEEDVYALWREVNAADVALAEQRRAARHPLPAPRSDLAAELAPVLDGLPDAPVDAPVDAVAVVVHVGRDRAAAVCVLLASVAAHTARPVRFLLLTQHPDELDAGALVAALPGHTVDVVDTRTVGGDLRAAGRKLPAADVDALLLPHLLPGSARAVVLPVDAVVEADVAELAELDLDGRLLAAAQPAGTGSASGFAVLNTAANRLGDQTVPAAELRRRAYGRHAFDFEAFDVSVLVVDLDAWRAHEVLGEQLSWVEEFGLGFRELLHLAVGPDRAVLPPRWHRVPGRDVVDHDVALLHWAGRTKPWSPDLAPEQDRWWAHR